MGGLHDLSVCDWGTAMSFSTSILARLGMGLAIAFAAIGTTSARVIDIQVNQVRGVDTRVDYSSLTEYGPWDDRNYQLTKEDLGYLSPNETESRDPTPAFFRVWMRKTAIAEGNPLPTKGPDQYPRSAVNTFLQRFEGLEIDGKHYRAINRVEGNRFEVFEEEELEEMAESWPRFVTGEVKITSPQGAEETAIAINPVNTNYVIAGSNGPGNGQKMWRSTNGGATWSSAISLSGNTCCDASVGWSNDGLIAYTSTLINCGSSCGVAFYRSTDYGQTWVQSPLLVSSGSDKEYLHVDSYPGSPYKDNIYVSWHQSNVQKFARSTDKGLTFSTPLTLDSAFKGIGSDLTSDKQGNVYYFFPSTGGRQIRVVKSTDGGVSFASSGIKVADTKASFDFPLPSMSTRNAFIYVAADTDFSNGPYGNSIYVAWPDTYATDNDSSATANHARVQVGYSRDGGATWTVTTPHPVSDGQTVDRYQQWLKVDQWGRVHVVYYDTRHSNNRTGIDVYYSVSLDGAQTWSTPRRLTTATSPKINTSMEWGDYNGMDMAMNDIIAIYTDNRAGIDVWGIGGFADSPGPDYGVALPTETQQVCAGSPIDPVTVSVSSLSGYTGSVALSLPTLNTSVFSGGMFQPPSVAVPADGSATSVLTLGTQPTAAAGTYPVLVRGVDNQSTPVEHEASFTVQIVAGTPSAPTLTAPGNGATGVLPNPTFTWAANPAATGYTIELATDSGFTTIVATGTPVTNSWTPATSLGSMTTYYWRVKASNLCGSSVTSSVFSFTTGGSFTIGGTVGGLNGPGLTLKLNNGTPLPITQGATTFVFPNSLPTSTAYAVTIGTPPSGQTCTVANGTGTVGMANITNVAVNCVDLPPESHLIGGRVRGLTSPGLVLQLNGGLTITQNGNGLYNFVPGLPPGVAYEITVMTQPAGLTCTVSNATGTMPNYAVSNVDVNCAPTVTDTIFEDGFELATP